MVFRYYYDNSKLVVPQRRNPSSAFLTLFPRTPRKQLYLPNSNSPIFKSAIGPKNCSPVLQLWPHRPPKRKSLSCLRRCIPKNLPEVRLSPISLFLKLAITVRFISSTVSFNMSESAMQENCNFPAHMPPHPFKHTTIRDSVTSSASLMHSLRLCALANRLYRVYVTYNENNTHTCTPCRRHLHSIANALETLSWAKILRRRQRFAQCAQRPQRPRNRASLIYSRCELLCTLHFANPDLFCYHRYRYASVLFTSFFSRSCT